MRRFKGFLRILLIVVSTTLWWYELIPAVQQVAAKAAPGFEYSWGFLFSFYGFGAVAIFGTASIGALLFLWMIATRLADWACGASGGVVIGTKKHSG